ncbi:MAG: zinc-ribbon domain-containing protein [Acetatifactor sp.]|nr:zinc-ribbon domain-containing protein [Acetatifactor sp.]
MREKIYRFMQGRYGSDGLNRFLMILSLIFFIVSAFGLKFFYLIGLATIIWAYFRMMSRNFGKRQAENARYMRYEYQVKKKLLQWKNRIQQSKTYHIYKCPSCKQKIRIPRGRGKIEIRCQKCGTTFIKKS